MSLQKVLLPDLQLHTEGKMSLFSPPWDIILMEIGYNLPLSRPKRTFCSDIINIFQQIKSGMSPNLLRYPILRSLQSAFPDFISRYFGICSKKNLFFQRFFVGAVGKRG